MKRLVRNCFKLLLADANVTQKGQIDEFVVHGVDGRLYVIWGGNDA